MLNVAILNRADRVRASVGKWLSQLTALIIINFQIQGVQRLLQLKTIFAMIKVEDIIALINENWDIDLCNPSKQIKEIFIDSLDVITLIFLLQKKFDVSIQITELNPDMTIQNLTDLLNKNNESH